MMRYKIILLLTLGLFIQTIAVPLLGVAKNTGNTSVVLKIVVNDPGSNYREFRDALKSTELSSYLYKATQISSNLKIKKAEKHYYQVSTLI